MSQLSEEEVDGVLNYWFSGNLKENYNTKWFPSAAKTTQEKTDAEIADRFGSLLFRALNDHISMQQEHTRSTLALILILDQFSRHVFRHNKEHADAVCRGEADRRALQLCEVLLGSECDAMTLAKTGCLDENLATKDKWDADLSVSEFVFALMPLRHSPTIYRLQYVLSSIDKRSREAGEELALLDRFRRQTYRRFQELQVVL